MNYYQSITESQDATDLELACLDQEKLATKEDLALLMATLVGSINDLMNLANEISETRNSITNDRQALSEQVGEKKNETRNTTPVTSKIPTRKTNPCYICGELGHWSPECPQKQDPPKKAKTNIPAIFVKTLDIGPPNALKKKIIHQPVTRKKSRSLENRI